MAFKLRDRVRLREDWNNEPVGIIPKGTAGTVVEARRPEDRFSYPYLVQFDDDGECFALTKAQEVFPYIPMLDEELEPEQ